MPLTLRLAGGLVVAGPTGLGDDADGAALGRWVGKCCSMGEKLETMSASAQSSAASSTMALLAGGLDAESARVRVGDANATDDDVAWPSSGFEDVASKLAGNADEESTKEPKPSDSVRACPDDSDIEPRPRRRSEDCGDSMLDQRCELGCSSLQGGHRRRACACERTSRR